MQVSSPKKEINTFTEEGSSKTFTEVEEENHWLRCWVSIDSIFSLYGFRNSTLPQNRVYMNSTPVL